MRIAHSLSLKRLKTLIIKEKRLETYGLLVSIKNNHLDLSTFYEGKLRLIFLRKGK